MQRSEKIEKLYLSALGQKFYYIHSNIKKEGKLKAVSVYQEEIIVHSDEDEQIAVFGFTPDELCANLLQFYENFGFAPYAARAHEFDDDIPDDIPFEGYFFCRCGKI